MDNGLNDNAENLEPKKTDDAINPIETIETTETIGTIDTIEPIAEEEKKKHGLAVVCIIGFAKFIWWILRMLWKLLKAMWRNKVVSLIVTALIAVAVCALFVVRCIGESDSPLSFEIGANQGIDKTPTLLTEVKKIGQWEFLSISDEEMIDTVRKGFFSDDQLTRIYYGTLRLGLDFSQCEEGWVSMEGDSVILNLPPVKLLDENFLDETRTQSFIESGEWTGADRQDMAERAKWAMRQRCLTPENLALAQQNAERQLREFFQKVIDNK